MEKCMQLIRELPTPQALKQQFPLDPSVAPIKEKRDAEMPQGKLYLRLIRDAFY